MLHILKLSWFTLPRTNFLFGHTQAVNRVFFSSDADLLFSASSDCKIRIWEVDSGHERVILRGPFDSSWLFSIALSRIDNHMACAPRGGKIICTWDNANGQNCTLLNTDSEISSDLVFSADGRMLAAGLEGGLVTIWDTATKKRLRDVNIPQHGFGSGVHDIAFSRESCFLAAHTRIGAIPVWDIRAGHTVAILTDTDALFVEFLPIGPE